MFLTLKIQKMTGSKLKENALALFLAAILALVVVFFINNTKFLKADIIGNQSENQNVGDAIYSVDDNGLSITSQKDIDKIKSVSIMVMFDKDKIKVTKDNIKTDYDFTISDAGDGNVNIMLQNLSKIKAGSKLLSINLDGKKDVSLSEIFVNFEDGGQDILSITKK